MARGGRRGPSGSLGHGGQTGRREREAQPALTASEQALLDALLDQLATMAAGLRAAQSAGRAAMIARLAPVEEASEPVALAFAQRLGDLRGPQAQDAADLAAALGEADPRREVAREARRARLRLRSAGAQPDVTLPAVAPTSPTPASPTPASPTPASPTPAPASSAASSTPPHAAHAAHAASRSEEPASTPAEPFQAKLVEAYATRTRESGEMTLILGWQESSTSELVRGNLIGLDFFREGVKHFIQTEPMTRKALLRETVEKLRGEEMTTIPVTWAQVRSLIEEALSVNEWRKVEPAQEFREHREQLDTRLLGEPHDEEQRAAIAAEAAKVAREGDRAFIDPDLQVEETLANWLGSWSFGDYGLAYDLLHDDAPLRRAQTRDEYIAVRRQWADEAQPAALRLTVIREQTQRASVLFVPGSAGRGGLGGKDEEAFWSLVLKDSPLGGAVEELPMATLISPETSRHWYWTAYTMQRERAYGLWCIARIRDEGASAQALTVDELQKRVEEAHTLAEQAAANAPQDPRSPQAAEAVRTVTASLCAALGYRDALLAKLPLDEAAYRGAIDDARTLNNHERAAAYLERMQGRFPDELQLRFELGLEQYLVAEQYASQGQAVAAADWMDRAIATSQQVVEAERTAEHLQALGELQARRGYLSQAEATLREAISLDSERASAYADLASAILARVSGEDLESPGQTATTQERDTAAREALAQLREAAKLDPNLPAVFTRIGGIYSMLGQAEDARLAFEEALSHDPGDADAHYALGTLYLERKEPQRALSQLENAVQLEPLAVPYRLALAAAYIALERRREATRELDLIERLQPHLPQVAELRAMLARQKK